jgi:hypothetical protein
VPPNARAACQSISIGAIYATTFITPLIYLPLNEEIQGWAMFMFIVPLALLTFYCYRRLPETHGVSLDTITTLLTQSEPIGALSGTCACQVTDTQLLPQFHLQYEDNSSRKSVANITEREETRF